MFEKTKQKVKPKPVAPSLRRRKSYSKEKSNCESDPYSSEAFIATSKALSSFVPHTLLRTLTSNIAKKNIDALRPYSTNFTGICLLADISDFTRLSGVFCARGKDGLDDLQSATSGYMGSLVETIYSYGGDVIKFAGDALVCVFKAQENKSLELTCAYALQCAWTLKDISTPELSLHVAISCGDICVGQLGGYENRWEYLISGSCLHQLSKCLNDAPKKEVAITPEFYENILKLKPVHMVLGVERQFSGNYLVEYIRTKIDLPILETESELFAYSEDSTLLSQTACYVPRPVTQALMTGSFNFLPELREVTTVFVKWDGYDHVEHKDLMSLQKFFYACQDILSDSGGFLRQFLIDDKGCVLIALWGVPTATFHDDCRRALGATVRIRCKLLDMKMPCSCGITSGIVYCGTVGNETRREYAAVGDVVNLAARLMSKADGEILLDEKTYSRLPEVIHKKLAKRPPMIVKGKDKPIVTYLFDSTHTVQADGRLASTLVDDVIDEELPIRQICRDAFAGPLLYLTSDAPLKNVQFLVLEGRLGTGREEAALWLKRHCNSKHLRIIPVTLSKADATISYKALAKIFRLLIREENFDDIGRQTFVVNTLLRQMFPKDVDTREKIAYSTMRRALGVTCPLTVGPNRGHGPKSCPDGVKCTDPSHLSEPVVSSNNSYLAFADSIDSKIPIRHMSTIVKDIFLTLCRDQPVVILIEEAHNLDESSWRILVSLLKVKAKVFIVLTEEPIDYLVSVFKTAGSDSSIGELIFPDSNILYDWIPPYLKKLTFDKKSSYILLPEFTFTEVRSYLATTLKLSQWQLPAGLDSIVYNLCGGSPYWFQEISQFLQVYGVKEFLSNLSGICRDNNHQPERRGQSDENSFYAFMQNRKSAIVHSFTSKPSQDPLDMSGTTDGIYAASDNSYAGKNTSSADLTAMLHNSRLKASALSAVDTADSESGFKKGSKLSSFLGVTKPGAKLEFLVVCRFAKLSVDEQRVARTASIIGTSFTSDVLHSLLPKQLRPYLPTILHALVACHWLKVSNEQTAQCVHVEYSFAHPLLQQTLYDLTPCRVRISMHLAIAQHIEEIHPEDVAYFMNLGFHYSRNGDHSKKTYEYLTRAAFDMVGSDHGNLDEGVGLIQTAAANASNSKDILALLGVVSKGLQRLKKERSTSSHRFHLFKAEKRRMRKESWKSDSSGSLFTAKRNPNPIDLKGRRIALKEIETVLERIKSKFERSESQNNREETIGEADAEGDEDSDLGDESDKDKWAGTVTGTRTDIEGEREREKRDVRGEEKNGGTENTSTDKNVFSRPPFYSHIEGSLSLTATVSGLQSPFITISESDKSNPSFCASLNGDRKCDHKIDEKYDEISDIEGEIILGRSTSRNSRDQIRHRFLERSERGGAGRKKLSRMSRNGTLRGHASEGEEDDDGSMGRRKSTGLLLSGSDASAMRAYSTSSLGNPITEQPWQIPLIKIRNGYLLQKALDNNKMRESSQDSQSYLSNCNVNSVSSMRSVSEDSEDLSRSDMMDDNNDIIFKASRKSGCHNHGAHSGCNSGPGSGVINRCASLSGIKIPSAVCTIC